MDPVFAVGQPVTVDIGGCIGNRTRGVIRSIKQRPELTTYEVAFPEYWDDARIETFYTAEALTPVR